jgi:hypothetical protein
MKRVARINAAKHGHSDGCEKAICADVAGTLLGSFWIPQLDLA